jgi:hypothetical protein
MINLEIHSIIFHLSEPVITWGIIILEKQQVKIFNKIADFWGITTYPVLVKTKF